MLGLAVSDDGAYSEPADCELPVEEWPLLHLRADFDGAALRLSASPDGAEWTRVGPVLDASKLSDDYGDRLRFTGAFVGVCAQDLGGTRVIADFDRFALTSL